MDWAKSIGGEQQDFGKSLSDIDNEGNIIITGNFSSTMDFDPGEGSFDINPNGENDVFIEKLDSNGNFLWVKTIGGVSDDKVNSIEIDIEGNIYITGSFKNTVDFDPGEAVFEATSPGSSKSLYILKLASDGSFGWLYTHTSHLENGYNITINNNEEIIIGANENSNLAFLKLDTNGNLIWSKTIFSSSSIRSNKISIDSNNNIYTVGYCSGDVDFDPGPDTYNSEGIGYFDSFILKIDTEGNFNWAKRYGDWNDCSGKDMVLDNDNNLFVLGTFHGTINFGTPESEIILTTGFSGIGAATSDYYIQKLDQNGIPIWAKSFGSSNESDGAYSIDIDNSNNIYILGGFHNTVDFDPDETSFELTENMNNPGVIHVLSPNGNLISATIIPIGGTNLKIDELGNILVIGGMLGTNDYDPTETVFNLSSNGGADILYLKLGFCPPSITTQNIAACDAYTWIDGNTYTEDNNTAMHFLTNAAGCDSIVKLNLSIGSSDNTNDIITACESYTWIDGVTYTENNNTATYTYTNTIGCDSIIHLNLTINPTDNTTDEIIACEPYTWIDGLTYTESNNTASYTLTNAAGCDSIVQLDLTIEEIDNSVSQAGYQLTANQTDASYQWLDCNNDNAAIPGATNQNFTPDTNGDYAVQITKNGCSETSTCYNVTGIGITENTFVQQISLYPNPSKGSSQIDMGQHYGKVDMEIYDAYGKLVYENTYNTQWINIDLNLPAGLFFINLSTNEKQTTLKWIVE